MSACLTPGSAAPHSARGGSGRIAPESRSRSMPGRPSGTRQRERQPMPWRISSDATRWIRRSGADVRSRRPQVSSGCPTVQRPGPSALIATPRPCPHLDRPAIPDRRRRHQARWWLRIQSRAIWRSSGHCSRSVLPRRPRSCQPCDPKHARRSVLRCQPSGSTVSGRAATRRLIWMSKGQLGRGR
jgi:hypothetical protein